MMIEWQFGVRIDNNAHRGTWAGRAGGERGVIGECGSDSDDDGIDPASDLMNDGARFRVADPSAVAGGESDPAIERHGPFGDDEGAAGFDFFEKWQVESG